VQSADAGSATMFGHDKSSRLALELKYKLLTGHYIVSLKSLVLVIGAIDVALLIVAMSQS
jgi:hypothetical protein